MQSQQFRGVWRNDLKGFDRNLYIALYEERSRLWNVYASRNRYCLNEANERSWSILVFIVIRLGIELEPPSSVSRIHPVRDVIMAAYLVAVSGKLEFFFFFSKGLFLDSTLFVSNNLCDFGSRAQGTVLRFSFKSHWTVTPLFVSEDRKWWFSMMKRHWGPKRRSY